MRIFVLLAVSLLTLSCAKEPSDLSTPLVGNWQLIRISSEDGSIMDSDYPENVRITFRTRAFLGDTGRNEFFGRYQVSGDSRLIFDDFGISEVAESELGSAFFQAFLQGYDAERKQFELVFWFEGNLLYLQAGASTLVFEPFFLGI